MTQHKPKPPDPPETIPDSLPHGVLRAIALMMGVLVAVVAGMVLHGLSKVLLPFCFAFFFSYLLYPIQQRLIGRRFPKSLAILVVLLMVFGVLNATGQILYASVATFTQELPKYTQRLNEMGLEFLDWMEIPLEEVKQQARDFDWSALLGGRSVTQAATAAISSTMGTFLGFLGQWLLILVLTVFILAGRDRTGRKIERALEPENAQRVRSVLESIQTEVQTYLVTKTLISLAVGSLVALTLWIFGVDFPLIWGLLTFVLNFIPNLGSIVASLFPLLVCFVQFGPSLRTLAVLILITTYQFSIGYLLEPRLLGSRMRLSPLLVLLSLVFWAYVWGIPGMILAVPITSAIKISFENVPFLRPIAIMMG